MPTEQEIHDAAKLINQGALVAFPTETVYGLGANALDPIAVAKIFELKGRPRLDPLIVHCATAQDVEPLVESVPPLAAQLIEAFWPGPLSLVLLRRSIVPDIVSAGLPTVAVRCPAHPVARKLIEAAGVPIAAPSANRFGRVSPTTAQHVIDQFGEHSPTVLDDGPCAVGVESTVVSFVDSPNGGATLLRPGGITVEQIESVIGPIKTHTNEEQRPTSPGQLSRHYAPTTPLVITTDACLERAKRTESKVGLLSFQAPPSSIGFAATEVLSREGCFREAAANLFAAMRRLDGLGLDVILAQSIPETDLGHAIMDRLRRAAAR